MTLRRVSDATPGGKGNDARQPSKGDVVKVALVVNALVGVITTGTLLSSCAVVELSGTMTKKTGEVMTEYSKENDGLIGRMAGFGGRINTAVGGAVEGIAQKGKDDQRDKSKTEEFVSAQKSVVGAALDAAKDQPSPSPIPMSIVEMQSRLLALGYEPGQADGVMGKRSLDALKKFQKDGNLPTTGRLDEETIAKLRKTTARK